MATKMSRESMELFLADLHVAIIGIPVKNRGPLAVPIWYAYEPGEAIRLMTFNNSWKAKLLKIGTRFSICVQDENPPYKFVSVEGPVVEIRDADLEQDIRPIVYRYLSQEDGDRYIHDTYPDPGAPGELYIRMKPEWWYSS